MKSSVDLLAFRFFKFTITSCLLIAINGNFLFHEFKENVSDKFHKISKYKISFYGLNSDKNENSDKETLASFPGYEIEDFCQKLTEDLIPVNKGNSLFVSIFYKNIFFSQFNPEFFPHPPNA